MAQLCSSRDEQMHCSSIDAEDSQQQEKLQNQIAARNTLQPGHRKTVPWTLRDPHYRSRLGRSRPGAGEFLFSAEGTDMTVVVSRLPGALRIRLGPQEAQCVLRTTEPSLQSWKFYVVIILKLRDHLVFWRANVKPTTAPVKSQTRQVHNKHTFSLGPSVIGCKFTLFLHCAPFFPSC